jgi:hypothetical protein
MSEDNFLSLWRLQDLSKKNKNYEIHDSAPGIVIFGDDGGSEAYAFDTRSNPWRIVAMPYVALDIAQARVIAPNFLDFLAGLQNTERGVLRVNPNST